MSTSVSLARQSRLVSNPLPVRCPTYAQPADNSFVDPNVESDIYADKPWALSPMVASMNNLSIGTSSTGPTVEESHVDLDGVPGESKGRAKYFGDKAHREAVGLKGKEVGMEFCNGLLGAYFPLSSPNVLLIHLTSLPMLSSYTRHILCSLKEDRLINRFQHPLSPTPTPFQASDPPYEILGRSTSNIRLSKTWHARR